MGEGRETARVFAASPLISAPDKTAMLRRLRTSELLLEWDVCYIPVRIPHLTSVSFVIPFAIFPVKEIERQDDWINFSFSVTRPSMHYPEVT